MLPQNICKTNDKQFIWACFFVTRITKDSVCQRITERAGRLNKIKEIIKPTIWVFFLSNLGYKSQIPSFSIQPKFLEISIPLNIGSPSLGVISLILGIFQFRFQFLTHTSVLLEGRESIWYLTHLWVSWAIIRVMLLRIRHMNAKLLMESSHNPPLKTNTSDLLRNTNCGDGNYHNLKSNKLKIKLLPMLFLIWYLIVRVIPWNRDLQEI